MGIVMALLAAMAGVGVLLWRINVASQAARDLVDTADEARGFFRRLSWNRKAKRHPLDLVEDPREAATAMMVALAQYRGALTEKQEQQIIGQMTMHFGMRGEEARDMFARARWVTRDAANLDAALKRLSPSIAERCTEDEKRDLIAMLKLIAGPGDPRDDATASAIRTLEDRLLGRPR